MLIGLTQEEVKMWTMDEFKRDRDKQILAVGIVFFLLAFPLYFNSTAGEASSSSFGGMDFYEVSGETSFIELDSGMEYVTSGDTWTIDDLSTDSIDNADDMNIVGVLVTLSYGEDETNSGGPPCAGPLGGQAAADTISGTVMHGQYNASDSGTNDDAPASHTVESLWYNESMVDAILFMPESEIIAGIDADGAGLGSYSLDITVDAEAGSAGPGCSRSDNGEEVSYKIELIVYDYTITSVLEPLME